MSQCGLFVCFKWVGHIPPIFSRLLLAAFLQENYFGAIVLCIGSFSSVERIHTMGFRNSAHDISV